MLRKFSGLAAICALAMALPALAQTDDGLVEATPEALGVTPEAFAKMGIPKGTRIRPIDFDSIEGRPVFGDPLPTVTLLTDDEVSQLQREGRLSVPIAPGAILERSVMKFDQESWTLASPIVLPAPYNRTLPAKAVFSARIEEGIAQKCHAHPEGERYAPIKDSSSAIYPAICAGEVDGEGRIRTVRLIPYRPIDPVRTVTIEPVLLKRWYPSPPFDSASLLAIRRVRVTAIEEGGARIVLEQGVFDEEDTFVGPDAALPISAFRQLVEAVLPLREGGTVALGGITLTVHRDGNGWRGVSKGGSGNFARVGPDRTSIILRGD